VIVDRLRMRRDVTGLEELYRDARFRLYRLMR
jgi:hypothetical protein